MRASFVILHCLGLLAALQLWNGRLGRRVLGSVGSPRRLDLSDDSLDEEDLLESMVTVKELDPINYTQAAEPGRLSLNSGAKSSGHAADLHRKGVTNGEGAGEVSEGGEGEEKKGKEGEDDEEVTNVDLICATFLFGFLVFDMVLLTLVHYKDPNVRCSIYKMISATLSIFCAVMINGALRNFIYVQLWQSPWPRGLGQKDSKYADTVIQFLFFTVFIFMLNVACWVFQKNTKRLRAVQEIGGHLMGFGAVGTFDTLQNLNKDLDTNMKWYLAVICIAGGVSMVYCFLTGFLRERLLSCDGGESEEENEEEEEEPKWVEGVKDGEDDAITICLSYLTEQTITLGITGRAHSMDTFFGRKHSWEDIGHLSLAAGIFMVLLMIVSIIRAKAKIKQEKHKGILYFLCSKDGGERMLNLLQTFTSFTMGWTVLRIAYWMVTKNPSIDSHLTTSAAAFGISALSVIAVIGLDRIADALGAQEPSPLIRSSTVNRDQTRALRSSLRESEENDEEDGINVFVVEELQEMVPSTRHLEDAVRTVITGFALTTGIAWEKAFDEALETIVKGVEYFNTHSVVCAIGLALVVVMIVLPPWLLYIVPSANKNELDHEAEIQLELAERRAAAKDSEDEDEDEEDRKKTVKAVTHYFQKISQEMRDEELKKAIHGLAAKREVVRSILKAQPQENQK